MANTLASDLVPDTVADMAITILQDRLAAIECFTTDFSSDLVDPTRPANISVGSSTSAVQTSPTNFETGDTTLTAVEVAPVHYSKSFHITQAERNSGHKLEKLLKINLHTLANGVMDKIMAPITAANFGTAHVAATPSDLSTDDLKTVWGQIPKANEKNLVLEATYFAEFLPTNREAFQLAGRNLDGAYGYDKFRQSTRFDGAGSGVVGFACDPQAIAVGARVPALDSEIAKSMIATDTVEIPGLGLSVQYCIWLSLATRTVWASYDLCIGSALLDASAGQVIATA